MLFTIGLISACLAVPPAGTAEAATAADLARFEAVEPHMGVKFRVILYAEDRATAERGFAAAFARIAELDAKLSDYKPDSELNKLCHSAPHAAPVTISDDLWRVLVAGQELQRRTKGAFDVTVGPLTKLWRTSRKEKRLADPKTQSEARKLVGGDSLVVLSKDKPQVQLMQAAMQLDLGGIAKGFAADEALKVLREQGIGRAMVAASGDMALGEAPPGKEGWKIGIAPLDPDAPPNQFLTLINCGVSTSGDSRQFVVIQGTRYSHIVDPRTGLGTTHRMSVTTIAPRAMQADSLATASYVLGPKAGLALCDGTPEVAVRITYLEPHDGQQAEQSEQNERMRRRLKP